MSNSVHCHCMGCKDRLCTSANSWIPMSRRHCTYEDSKQFTEYQLETLPSVREGSPESQLEGCSVKPVQCRRCRRPVGVRCVEATPGKEQCRDRFFFHLPQLDLYDTQRHQLVQPMIKNFGPPPNAPSAPPMPAPAARENGIERKPITGEPPKSIDRTLADQRNDIDRILLIMNDLKRGMTFMQATISEMQASGPAESRNPHRRSDFPEELVLLTENVSRLNSRVGDIDGFRLEMIVMKRRIRVLEQGYNSSQSSHTVTGYTPPATSRPTPSEQRVNSLATRPAHRPMYPNGAPEHVETDRPVVASSVESRPPSTDLYGVSPEYRARAATANGDQEIRDGSSGNISSSIPSTPSSLDSFSEPSPPVEARVHFQTPKIEPPPTSAARSLNDRDVIMTSDPDDSTWDRDSQRPRTRNQPHGTKVRLQTPEWEKPNWNGPRKPNEQPILHSNPLGAPEPDPKRRKTSSFAEGLGNFAPGLPPSWREGSYHTQSTLPTPSQSQGPISTFHTPTENSPATYVPSPISPAPPLPPSAASGAGGSVKQDLRSVPRARDAQGRLLRPDGKIDGRSVRYGHPPKSASRRASAGDALKSRWPPVNSPDTAHGFPQQVQSPTTHGSPNLDPRERSAVPSPQVGNPDEPPPPLAPRPNTIAASAFQAVKTSAAAAPKVESPAPQPPPEDTSAAPQLPKADSPAPTPPPNVDSPAPPPARVDSPAPKAATPAQEAASLTGQGQADSTGSPAPNIAPTSPGNIAKRDQARAARRARLEKERDDEGNLRARNGRIDGRSLRYKRMKEEREGAAAQLEGAS